MVVVAAAVSAALFSLTGPAPYRQWADASRMPLPAAAVQVVYSTQCPSACTDGVATIWIGANADTWSPVRLYGYPFGTDGLVDERRLVFLHELGHFFDRAVLTVDDRLAFDAIVGLHRDWTTSPNSPEDVFAQAYALASLYAKPKPPLNTTWYGFDPSPRQFSQIVALIRAAAGRVAP
jgi:hypothetical protein